MRSTARKHGNWAVISLGILVVVFGLAVFRIAGTYAIYSQTFDEAYHIACGMEWLSQGTYTYEVQHPPLVRIGVALGPYLLGIRSYGNRDPEVEGNAVLNNSGQYFRVLTAARLGNLIFFALSCACLAIWAWRQYGPLTAVFSTLLFTILPPILAHAGLATTDLGCTAGVTLALLGALTWIEKPDFWRTVAFGLVLGVAFLMKFLVIFFVGVCAVAAFLLMALRRGKAKPIRPAVALRPLHLALAVLACLLVLWAGYRFRVTRFAERPGVQALLAEMSPARLRFAKPLAEIPLPLTEFVRGLNMVWDHNSGGHPSFLFGHYSRRGWWYFFPVVLGVKTPVAFLLLALIGAGMMLRLPLETWWPKAAPVFFAAAMLLSVLPSHINLGVRHILPIYAPLALCGGYALARGAGYFKDGKRLLPAAAVILLLLACAESASAHHDYLPWFNVLAGDHPERVLVDSDLDWGQDLHRLSERLSARNVPELAIAYFGAADLSRSGLPPYHAALPFQKTTGWVAVSVRLLMLQRARDGSFAWLANYRPVEWVGKSIWLYYVDE
jgi:hypothetical protein